jgi:HlyD family secretion protein
MQPMSSPPVHPVEAPPKSTRPVRAALPKRRKRHTGWWILLVLVVGAAVGGFFWWRHHTQQLAAQKASEKNTTVAVSRGLVEKTIESSGTVAANLEVEIKCRASGEIVKLPFDISDSVKKGDLLCQLDPTDEQLSVRSAEVKVAQAQAKLAQAKANLEQATQNLVTTRTRTESALASAKVKAANARTKADRQKELVSQKLGSQEEYESAETEAASALADQHAAEVAVAELKQQEIALESKRQDVQLAAADLQSSQIVLDQQKKQLDYTTVTAPMDGTVSALDVQIGTIVASGTNNVSGGTTILTLADLSRVFVNATVDEADIGGVRVGQKARVSVDSYPGRNFAGAVVRVAVKGATASNVVTFEVKVEITDEHKALLKPEMTANVAIIEADQADALMLPASAIQRLGRKNVVKLPSGEQRQVELGIEGSEKVEIKSGLADGELVVANSGEQPSRWRVGTPGAMGPRPR